MILMARIFHFRYWYPAHHTFPQAIYTRSDIQPRQRLRYNLNYTTSVHFLGKAVGWSRGFSHFCSQMTPSQRPIL